MKKIELSLTLPVQNQEDIIAPVVTDIHKILSKAKIPNEIILVENGSTDNTYKVLAGLSKKYSNVKPIIAKKGYGSAVLAGLSQSQGAYVSYMPSDGQLDPKLLPLLYQLIKSGKYDLVKIKRTTRENLMRTIRSKIFNLLTSLLFTITVFDINGSPRIFKKMWLPILNLKSEDSFIDCEMAIKASFLNWRIKEIPARTLPRLGGESTVNIKTVIEFIRNLLNYRLGEQFSVWQGRLDRTKK